MRERPKRACLCWLVTHHASAEPVLVYVVLAMISRGNYLSVTPPFEDRSSPFDEQRRVQLTGRES